MLRTAIDGRYALAGEFLVSADTWFAAHDIVTLSLGAEGWVAVWTGDLHQDQSSALRMQRYDLGGHKVGGEIALGAGGTPAISRLADGGFVVAYTQQSGDPNYDDVKVRLFDSHGNPVGGAIAVNTATVGIQTNPHVAGLSGGGFVVTWETGQYNPSTHVEGQLFTSAGQRMGGTFQADDFGTHFADNYDSHVVALPNGGFIVSWFNFSADANNSGGSLAQIFDSSGARSGSALHLNPPLPGSQFNAAIAALADGRLIAAWTDEGFGSDAQRGIWVQLLDSSGTPTGNPVKASTLNYYGSSLPTIAVTADGFIVVWEDRNPSPDDSYTHIRAQAFDLALAKVGAEFAVSPATTYQFQPSVIVLDNGAVVVAYSQGLGKDSEFHANMLFPASYGTAAGDNYVGGEGRDFYQALAGDDIVFGAGGDDWLVGGAGNDSLDGGDGDDILSGGDGLDSYQGGAGVDTASFADETGAGAVTVNLTNSIHVEPAANAGGSRSVAPGEALDSYGFYESLSGIENVITGAGDDRVYGGLGANRVETGAGNDLLSGGGGADVLIGGSGDDTYLMLPLNDPTFLGTIVELADGGTDRIATYLAETALPTSASVENLLGLATTGQILIGNALGNSISGGSGNDVLLGGNGTDLLNGGDGIDTVDYSRENGLLGILVNLRSSAISYTLGAHTARDSFGSYDTLTSIENVKTGGGADTVYGDSAANRIETGAGRDRLIGGGGADLLIGGPGDDIYFVRAADGPSFQGTIVEAPGEGIDEIQTDLATFSLAGFPNVERLVGLNPNGHFFTGNEFDNELIGWLGADTLEGGAGNDFLGGDDGADTMRGGTGDDTYLVDALDLVEELPGEGVDTVRTGLGTSSAIYVLPANVENFVATWDVGQTVAGNALDNLMTMGWGNDVLDLSAGGNDTAIGNGGDDYIYFGAAFTAADTIVGGTGTDTVGLLGNYNLTLGANSLSGVENLSLLSGTAAGGTEHVTYSITTLDANVPAGGRLTVYGGGLLADESLFFNGYAETDGALSVYGGAGNDTFAGGPGNDAFVGGAGDDVMYGLGGMDWLEGGLGADTMRGGLGNDLFVYQSAAESTAAKTDRIVDFEFVSDHIYLTHVDADTNAAGDQDFTFIGSNAFSHTAGELRAYQSGASWFVEGDIDGDGNADLVIQVDPVAGHAIIASDFLL